MRNLSGTVVQPTFRYKTTPQRRYSCPQYMNHNTHKLLQIHPYRNQGDPEDNDLTTCGEVPQSLQLDLATGPTVDLLPDPPFPLQTFSNPSVSSSRRLRRKDGLTLPHCLQILHQHPQYTKISPQPNPSVPDVAIPIPEITVWHMKGSVTTVTTRITTLPCA